MSNLLPQVYLVNCRDRRLLNLIEQVFSSEMKIPSLKFSLLCSYAGFILLCMIGIMSESMGLNQVATVIKVAMLVWFGILAGMLSPVFYFASQHDQGPWILAIFIPMTLLLVPLWKYLSQPSTIELDSIGIRSLFVIGPFRFSHAIEWNEIRSIYFAGTQNANTDEWQFTVATDQAQVLAVRLGCITNHDDRIKLLEFVQNYCPNADVDHRILQAWTPAHSNSYTEIWLQSLASPPKRARLAPLEEGMLLQDGKYEIKSVLATGGQAVVYLAVPKKELVLSGSERQIVLKEMIIPIYGDENLRRRELERFDRESRLLTKLDCDNIVKLLDYFIEDHRGYLAMEFISGNSLVKLVSSKGALPESQVIELAEQMCSTLSYLHGLSPPVVHRDFTPDNLILTEQGCLKLIDFNVAQEAKFTTTATVVGKHAYLPPEQFRGKPCPPSDIYALGGTLHFLLTGSEPEPISSSHPILVNENVSEEMNRIVAKATEPELKDRYSSIAEMQADLRALAGNRSQVE
jgi:tRNA A-37 threonylcarbamoyl transferase component Bud32